MDDAQEVILTRAGARNPNGKLSNEEWSERHKDTLDAIRSGLARNMTVANIAISLSMEKRFVIGIIRRGRKRGVIAPATEAWLEWSDADVERLWQYTAEARSFAEIARALGRSTQAIRNKCSNLGIKRKKRSLRFDRKSTSDIQRDKATVHSQRIAALEANGTYGHAAAALEVAQATDGCRWPVGEPESPDFHFCCATRERHDIPFQIDRSPYCSAHRAMSKAEPTGSIKAAEIYPRWAA